jgi:diguanylate cyclase (GGDEF)-like protein/PAS domain S-box-containing protein
LWNRAGRNSAVKLFEVPADNKSNMDLHLGFRVKSALRVLRFACVTAFLITFAFAVGHTGPELLHSITALSQIKDRDLRDLSLTVDLENQLQKTGEKFQQLLKDSDTRVLPLSQLALLDRLHDQVDTTVQKLSEAAAAQEHLRNFVQAFSVSKEKGYAALEVARTSNSANGEAALSSNGGLLAYFAALKALANMKLDIQHSLEAKLEEASKALNKALIQLVVLLGVTLGCAILFSWLESRHRRMLAELEETHRNLNESEERFQRAYEEAAVGMALLDLNGHLLGANRAMSEITGFEHAELMGKSVSSLLDPVERVESAAFLQDLVRGARGSYRVERRAIRKDGKPMWARNSLSLLHAGGKPARIFLIAEDVTERRAAFELIEYQASHDVITSLPNRFRFENRLRELIAGPESNSTEVAGNSGAIQTSVRMTGLLYLDLDGFKLVNDTLGHGAGDSLLKEVADRLSTCLPGPDDLVARLGGDEFAIIIADSTGRNELARIAASLLKALEAPFRIDGKDQHIGATIGIALAPEDGADPESLVRNADEAMYAAKRAGRNRFGFFTASMRKQAKEKLAIEANLRQALQRQEFYVVFQPLYDVQTGRLARMEALCRWQTPGLGDVPPVKFIAAAEQSGMIVDLGRFVLRESCKQARLWADCGSTAGISVNVSAIQFASADFFETVKTALAESGIEPSRLQLELTESVILKNIEAGVLMIERLKNIGVKVSIDDFGTGYSSLSYLQRMPVHAVKIDRSFITDVDTNEGSVSMIRSVIALARAVGLTVVTEGVETESQLELLRELGCDEVQGYLLGRPESAADAMARVRHDRWSEVDTAPRQLTAA